MKIAVDARPLCQGPNGISRYLASLLPRLTRSGDHWILYSDRPLPETVMSSLNGRVSTRWGAVRSRGLSTPFAQANFPKWARQDDVQLFWSPRHHLPLGLRTQRKLVTVHDLVWRKVPGTMARLGQLTERLLMPPSLRMADAVLAPSKATADDLAYFYPEVQDKVYVTPLASALLEAGLDARDNRVAPSSVPIVGKNILMVGSLEPRKNVGRVLDAFARLQQEFADVTLTLAGGSGWKNRDLLERLQNMRGRGVDYLGAVDDEALGRLYERARFVVAPSLYEGCGLSVLEAFAFGKPVVTANLSSMPEVAGAGGVLVDPYATNDIYSAMRLMLTDDQHYQQYCKAAREQGKQFSWQKTAAATTAVIDALR